MRYEHMGAHPAPGGEVPSTLDPGPFLCVLETNMCVLEMCMCVPET